MIYHVTKENLVEVVKEAKLRLSDVLDVMKDPYGSYEVFIRVHDEDLNNPHAWLNRFEHLRVFKSVLLNTPGLKDYIMTEDAWR